MGCACTAQPTVNEEEQLSPTELFTGDREEDDFEDEKTILQQKRGGLNVKKSHKRKKSTAKSFWEAQSKQIAKEEKQRKKRAKKTKKETEWKFKTVEKPKIVIESVGTKEIVCHSPRDSKGNLRLEIAGVKTRSQNLEQARIEEGRKLSQDVEKMRRKRENSMRTLDRSDFVAAQDAVSRALLKRPDDYEFANNENTEKLQQGMKDMFKENSADLTLTKEKEEKFVEILQLAGVLVSAPAELPKPQAGENTEDKSSIEMKKSDLGLLQPAESPSLILQNEDLGKLQPMESPSLIQVEQKKPEVFKEINLNASQFLHTAKEKDKKVFVDTVCQLFEKIPTFEEVKFNYGALNEDNVVKIAESLAKCENLQAVYFDSNDFGSKGVKALIKLMDTHKDTLTTLSMQNLPVWQQISTELLGQFVEAIERSTALVKLGFDLKEFRHWEYKDRVSKALKRNAEIARLKRVKKKREKSTEIS